LVGAQLQWEYWLLLFENKPYTLLLSCHVAILNADSTSNILLPGLVDVTLQTLALLLTCDTPIKNE
jgi:hypothetical protein